MVIFDRQQPDIGRPRQREGLSQFGEIEFPRHCLGFLGWRLISQFPRHCLGNLGLGVCEEETPHTLQVVDTEPAPESGRQIGGQARHQLLAVTSPPPAFLLGFDDSAANLPIAGRHQRIDTACRSLARRIQQFHDAAVDAGVASRQGGGGFPRHRKRLLAHEAASSARRAPVIVLRRFATSSAAWRTGSSSVWT